MTLSPKQRRDVDSAVRHLGRAMRALARARVPDGASDEPAILDLNRGERLLGQASDKLIDGLLALDGVELLEDEVDDDD